MGIEIEHKYLVKGDDYRLMACRTHEIKQGFLSRVPERVVRVRVRDDKGFITIKGRSQSCAPSRGFRVWVFWKKTLS